MNQGGEKADEEEEEERPQWVFFACQQPELPELPAVDACSPKAMTEVQDRLTEAKVMANDRLIAARARAVARLNEAKERGYDVPTCGGGSPSRTADRMMTGCPIPWLLPFIAGSCGAIPPPTPKDKASDRELWLEKELIRLKEEEIRLEEINENLRTESFFRDAMPMRRMSEWYEHAKALGEVSPTRACSASSISSAVSRESPPMQGKIMPQRLASGAENIDEEDMDDILVQKDSGTNFGMRAYMSDIKTRCNVLAMSRPAQFIIYLIGVGFVVFVILATAFHLGEVHYDEVIDCHGGDNHSCELDKSAPHRRLGGGASPIMKNLAFTMTMAGLVCLGVNFIRQPLILGYLVAGLLVGPTCLHIVESPMAISDLSSLGLIFLLFMIGLELNIKRGLKAGKVSLVTGLVQFPICAAVATGIFLGLEQLGLTFGGGKYSLFYCGITSGLSSTMIVVRQLDSSAELESQSGRMTLGVLIWQDLWAGLLLAIQMNLNDPTVLGVLKSFGLIVALVIFALVYAKFIMPAVLFYGSQSVELMLVLSLAWCFFICCVALLTFVDLPMELAALIAGIALGTFPYSKEFNSKIKYIRDFFFTLFFAGMGMMLPVPTADVILTAFVIAVTLLLVRPLGAFVPPALMGKNGRLSAYCCINLSQFSEFSLVICSLGVANGHIDEETLNIVIIAFAILAVCTSYMMSYKFSLVSKTLKLCSKFEDKKKEEESDDEESDRPIVLLGFHKIAYMLIAEMQVKTPELLAHVHIIDFNKNIHGKLKSLGIKCTYGDIASSAVLRHARKEVGDPRVVICSIPDSILQGLTNQKMVVKVKDMWQNAHVVAIADNPEDAKKLYECGASYVIRMAKLSAQRLGNILREHDTFLDDDQKQECVTELFAKFKEKDNANQSAEVCRELNREKTIRF